MAGCELTRPRCTLEKAPPAWLPLSCLFINTAGTRRTLPACLSVTQICIWSRRLWELLLSVFICVHLCVANTPPLCISLHRLNCLVGAAQFGSTLIRIKIQTSPESVQGPQTAELNPGSHSPSLTSLKITAASIVEHRLLWNKTAERYHIFFVYRLQNRA